jgi:hypothetical protein
MNGYRMGCVGVFIGHLPDQNRGTERQSVEDGAQVGPMSRQTLNG